MKLTHTVLIYIYLIFYYYYDMYKCTCIYHLIWSVLFTGYGRVTPLSDEGKGFIIVYTVIGIPLTLILFSAIVERLMIPTKVFLYFLFRKLGHLYKVFHIQLLHLFFVILVLLVFIFLIPAAVYSTLEPTWNYLDAFYYCFISMTTIGLGDYIPGDNPEQELRPLYKVATTCKLDIYFLFILNFRYICLI